MIIVAGMYAVSKNRQMIALGFIFGIGIPNTVIGMVEQKVNIRET